MSIKGPSVFNVTEDARNEDLARWEIFILAIIFAVTIIGNTLILLSLYWRRLYRRRKKMTRMYFFILHLSVADVVTAVFDVLPQLIWDITFRFKGGPVLCKLVKFLQPLGPYLSSYILVGTAIDRYHAICHPLSYCRTTSRQSRFMVYSAWILAVILCIPQVFVFSYQQVSTGIWDCWATFNLPFGEKAYVTCYSVTVFFLPYCVLVYTYLRICARIWNNRGPSGLPTSLEKGNVNGSNRGHIISKAKIKTVKQTIAVFTLYATTHSPFISCQLWAVWDGTAASSPFIDGPLFTIFSLLSSLPSAANPWVYLSFNPELRRILLEQLCRTFHIKRLKDKTTQSSNSTENSARSTFVSRMSRYASLVIHHSTVDDEESRN